MSHKIIILSAVVTSLLCGCDEVELGRHVVIISDGKSYREVDYPNSLAYSNNEFLFTPTGGVVTIYLKQKEKRK